MRIIRTGLVEVRATNYDLRTTINEFKNKARRTKYERAEFRIKDYEL